MTDSDHIMQLRQQVSNLHARLKRIMEGLEGTCMTCEPVGIRNQQMEQHIKTLQAERDEARREVCECKCSPPKTQFFGAPQELAEVNGWDCFGEDGK